MSLSQEEKDAILAIKCPQLPTSGTANTSALREKLAEMKARTKEGTLSPSKVEAICKDNVALLSAYEDALEALEFYAAQRFGKFSHAENAVSDLEWDSGDRARQALAKLKEMLGEI